MFRAESLGRGPAGTEAYARGTFDLLRTLSARSQDDFENLPGRRVLAEGLKQHGRPERDRTATWPYYPVDSLPGPYRASYPSGGAPARYEARSHYPPLWGSIRLMDSASGATAPKAA